MDELLPVANLLVRPLTVQLFDVSARRIRLLLESGRLLPRRGRLTSREADHLHEVWKAEWAVGHFAVLLGAAEPDSLAHLVARDSEMLETGMFDLMVGGLWPTTARALWLTARVPWRDRVPLAAGAEAYAATFPEGTARVWALAFFGTRVGAARPDVLAALERIAALGTEGAPPAVHATALAAILMGLGYGVDFPKGTRSRVASNEDRVETDLTFWRLGQPPGTPVPATGSEKGDRLACQTREGRALVRRTRSAWVNRPEFAFRNDHISTHLPFAMGWLARAAPRDLYQPERDLEATARPWHPDLAWPWLEALASVRRLTRTPVRREEPKVSRNAPCPCGSGLEHKRCCGA